MLSVSHVATGALIATKVTNPFLSIPLILASHYLEDWIPHWDVGTGLSNGTRSRTAAFVLELFDLAASVALVYFFWQHSEATLQIHAWMGAFVGLVPDFIEAPRNFLKIEPWFFKPLNQFHHGFHNSTPNMLIGLAPQILLLVVIWFLR